MENIKIKKANPIITLPYLGLEEVMWDMGFFPDTVYEKSSSRKMPSELYEDFCEFFGVPERPDCEAAIRTESEIDIFKSKIEEVVARKKHQVVEASNFIREYNLGGNRIYGSEDKRYDPSWLTSESFYGEYYEMAMKMKKTYNLYIFQ